MRATFPLLLSACCLASASVHAAKPKSEPLDAAPQLISTKGHAPRWKNLDELRQFAQRGDARACLELGQRSLEGDGVPRDVKEAAMLFERAAKGGVADGWFRLGKIYHDGLDGAPDFAKAREHFTQAARGGIAEAQHNLGAMLVSARGVKRDYIEGLAWLIVAKQNGAPSDAEEQVRSRLARRPAEIAAAEARAAEIAADLTNASVRTGVGPPRAAPVKPALPADAPTPLPGMTRPQLDPVVPPKVVVPVPTGPTLQPGKP